MNLSPWTIDAGNLDIADIVEADKAQGVSSLLVLPAGNQAAREYLTAKIGSPKKVVVAPKGYGKTLLLRYRAHWLRTMSDSNVAYHPSNEDDIDYLTLPLDSDQIHRYAAPISTADKWCDIWEASLVATACQVCGIKEFSSTLLNKMFVSNKDVKISVGDNLGWVIANRKEVLSSRHMILKAFHQKNKDVALFIDNADEAFKSIIDYENKKKDGDAYYDYAQDNPKSWNDLQVGLLLAIRRIERTVKKLHVYTTLRAEAFNGITDERTLQARDHCIDLIYTKNTLKKIFIANIELILEEYLAKPASSDPLEKWLGVNKVSHSYVLDDEGGPAEEDVFDFIHRHTLNSPREIMIIGRYLSDKIPMEMRRDSNIEELVASVKDCVNFVAKTQIYEQWKIGAVPRWDTRYDKLLGRIKSNVIRNTDIKYIDEDIEDKNINVKNRLKLTKFTDYLYQHGLLGYLQKFTHNIELRQKFMVSWEQRYAPYSSDRMAKLHPSERYLVHPVLNDVIRHSMSNDEQFLPDVHNIIGYDRPYFIENRGIDKSNVRNVFKIEKKEGWNWPCVEVNGVLVVNGEDKEKLVLPQHGTLLLLYSMYYLKKERIKLSELERIAKAVEVKFGKNGGKSWINSFVKKNSGHANQSIAGVLDVLELGKYLSCRDKNEEGIPFSIEVKFCKSELIELVGDAELEGIKVL